jgi:hypothetical protein
MEFSLFRKNFIPVQSIPAKKGLNDALGKVQPAIKVEKPQMNSLCGMLLVNFEWSGWRCN